MLRYVVVAGDMWTDLYAPGDEVSPATTSLPKLMLRL